jgi:hypothetical protein
MEWIAEEFHALTLDGNVCSTMLRKEQELVRCKDCKKRNQHHECEYGYHSDDWFCADGERQEGR